MLVMAGTESPQSRDAHPCSTHTVFSMIYCYDGLFALQNQLQDTYKLSTLQYTSLYSVYGYVNVVLPLLSGLLIDWLGINSSSLLFYALVVCGQTLWLLALLPSVASYPLMMVGRALFASGTQPFHTSRKFYLGRFFIAKEYILASALTISASRAASAVAAPVSSQIYGALRSEPEYGIILSFGVGQVLVLASMLWLVVFVALQRTRKSDKVPLLEAAAAATAVEIDAETEKKFHLWDALGAFDRSFWFLSLALALFYGSYMSFTTLQSSFLQARFGYSNRGTCNM